MEGVNSSAIEKLRKKPSLFVEKVIGVDPVYDYQKEFLDKKSDRKTIVAGRQTGKTTMMSWLAIHEFVMYPNRRILLVAPTKRQAKNFMRKLQKEISDWLDNPDEFGISEVLKMRLEGDNGSWIQAVPALEETIRGLTIDSAFVDEAAFVSRKVFTSVISPMLATTNGQFVLGSTPWGKDSYLYDKFNDDYWFSKRVSSTENPEIPAKQIEEWRRDMSPQEFSREVLGVFTEKKNSFFSNRDINRCLQWAKKIPDGENIIYPDRKTRDSFIAVDPATGGDDEAVITSIDLEGNVYDIHSEKDCTVPELEGEIRDILNKSGRNYIGGYIEENGIGEGTVHRFEKEFPVIEGFRATLRSKESVYQQAKNQMQKGDISIPDVEKVKKQLRNIEYEMTERGNKKIHAPEGEHDDFADSLVLAVASLSERSFVNRQDRAYSFGSSSNSVNRRTRGKRAYSFGG